MHFQCLANFSPFLSEFIHQFFYDECQVQIKVGQMHCEIQVNQPTAMQKDCKLSASMHKLCFLFVISIRPSAGQTDASRSEQKQEVHFMSWNFQAASLNIIAVNLCHILLTFLPSPQSRFAWLSDWSFLCRCLPSSDHPLIVAAASICSRLTFFRSEGSMMATWKELKHELTAKLVNCKKHCVSAGYCFCSIQPA